MASKTSSKAKPVKGKLPISITLRLAPEIRKKLSRVAKDQSLSETALVEQLCIRFLDRFDLGPRVDALETRLRMVEHDFERLRDERQSAPVILPTGPVDDDPDQEDDDAVNEGDGESGGENLLE